MDTTAIALSVGIPCLGMFFMQLLVIIAVASNWDTTRVEWALQDERTIDRMVLCFINKRLNQIPQELENCKKILRVQRYLSRKAAIMIRDDKEVVQALLDLENMSYRRRVAERLQKRKSAITLPYYQAVGV